MSLVKASFFWRNNEPDGLGVTFMVPAFTSEQLSAMFEGEELKRYLRNSDLALGTSVVKEYLTQLSTIGLAKAAGAELSMSSAVLAALNIIWLTERGFIPNNEFNGYQLVYAT